MKTKYFTLILAMVFLLGGCSKANQKSIRIAAIQMNRQLGVPIVFSNCSNCALAGAINSI
jgi:hypothetical protein